MDPILIQLLRILESLTNDGNPFQVHLTIVTGGSQFSGEIITEERFFELGAECMRTIATSAARGLEESAIEMGTDLRRARGADFLHILVDDILTGSSRQHFEHPMPMRFDLEAIAGWASHVPAPSESIP